MSTNTSVSLSVEKIQTEIERRLQCSSSLKSLERHQRERKQNTLIMPKAAQRKGLNTQVEKNEQRDSGL